MFCCYQMPDTKELRGVYKTGEVSGMRPDAGIGMCIQQRRSAKRQRTPLGSAASALWESVHPFPDTVAIKLAQRKCKSVSRPSNNYSAYYGDFDRTPNSHAGLGPAEGTTPFEQHFVQAL